MYRYPFHFSKDKYITFFPALRVKLERNSIEIKNQKPYPACLIRRNSINRIFAHHSRDKTQRRAEYTKKCVKQNNLPIFSAVRKNPLPVAYKITVGAAADTVYKPLQQP